MLYLAFKGIPANPIMPPVIISGMMLGIRHKMIILKFLNSTAMINAMMKNAMIILVIKLSIKNLLPLINSKVVPVMETFIFVSPKISSIFGCITSLTNTSNLLDPMSAIFRETLIFCPVLSTNAFEIPCWSDSFFRYLKIKFLSRLFGNAYLLGLSL